MTFQPTKPAAGDYLAESQVDLKNNFSTSNTYFGTDHVAFNATSDQGKHNQSTYLDQGADPATGATECAVYGKSLGGASTLYMRKASSGTVIQLSGADPVIGLPGQTFLPGGIIMKWGTAAIISGAGGTTVTFASAFPNNCWVVTLTPLDANANYASVISRSTANFVARANNAITVQWIAIGN